MSEEEEDGEKQYEASQKKLEDARKKGEFPRSVELMTAASYGGSLLTAVWFGQSALLALGDVLRNMLDRPTALADQMFQAPGTPVLAGLLLGVGMPGSVWLLVPLACVLLMVFAQQAMVFATDKLKPKVSKVSLIQNAKNKFGRNGLFEFGKSAVKLIVYSVVLFSFLLARLPEMIAAMALSSGQVTALMLDLSLDFMMLVFLVTVITGAVDYFWQRAEHLRKHRMSRKELTDEAKDSEGDPYMKQQRRDRATAIATNRMLADVPGADVVIVNPTHFAVALKWSRAPGSAPVCLAKGVDEVAARIREAAMEAGVPIHRDAPTARAIFASVEIGREIMPEQYRAVAAALRFAERMRMRAKGGVSRK